MMVGRTDRRYPIRVTGWLTRMTERRWTNLTQWQTDFYCSFERYLLSSVSPSPSSSLTLSLYLLLCIFTIVCVCLSFFVAFQFLVGCALRSGLNHVKTTTISCRRIYYCVLLFPIEVIIAIAILSYQPSIHPSQHSPPSLFTPFVWCCVVIILFFAPLSCVSKIMFVRARFCD